jgi:hypothetical protein
VIRREDKIRSIKISKRSFEDVAKFLGTTQTDQNCMEESRSRLMSGNAKVKICKTIMLPVVLYGCETWSLTIRVQRSLRVFENRVLRIYIQASCCGINFNKMNIFNYSIYMQLPCTSYNIFGDYLQLGGMK